MTTAAALTFAPARPFEALELAQFARDHIEDGLPWRWTPQRLGDCIRDPDQTVLVVRSGPHIVGCGIMVFRARSAHLALLGVHPRWRRHGIGRRLLEWLEKSADVAGIQWIDLEVRANRPEARRFGTAVGYAECEYVPHFFAGREAAIRLRRQLRRPPPDGSDL